MLVIVGMTITAIVKSAISADKDDFNEYSYFWIVMKTFQMLAGVSNFIVIIILFNILQRQHKKKILESKETFASAFFEMRMKQLKYFSISFVVFIVLEISLMILLFAGKSEMKFLSCYKTCSIPTEIYSAMFLFLFTLLFLMIVMFSGYIFYIVPRNFIARVVNYNPLNVEQSLIQNGSTLEFAGQNIDIDEFSLIMDMQLN